MPRIGQAICASAFLLISTFEPAPAQPSDTRPGVRIVETPVRAALAKRSHSRQEARGMSRGHTF